MWTSDTIQARLKAYEDELPLFMRDYHLPGLSIAITNRHEVLYATAYGARQLATNLPNTVETLHGIGSVSKSLTCVAVLQLAEQGKLSLEDPIKYYLEVSIDKDIHAPIRIPFGQKTLTRHFHKVYSPPITRSFSCITL